MSLMDRFRTVFGRPSGSMPPSEVAHPRPDGLPGLSRTQERMDGVHLDGVAQAALDLAVSLPGKPLAHYVLFGPAEHAATSVNLVLAQDYLLAFRPAFGFSPAEAAQAGMVTIVANTNTVSGQVQEALAAGGVPVQRIAGSIGAVTAALADRVASGRPF